MHIKILCVCGTKLAFDAEPVDGQMPCAVVCPTCQLDITEGANAFIAQMLAVAPPAISIPIVEAPVSKLRVGGHKAEAPAAASTPPPVPTAPAQPPPPAPAASGLSVTRKKAEHTEPTPEPEMISSKPEAIVADDSFESRRAKRVAKAQGKQEAQSQEWGKLAKYARIAAVIIFTLLGVYTWYAWIGSAPSEYYTVHLKEGSYGARAKLKSPDELVVIDGQGVSLHDLKSGKAVWTMADKGNPESEDRFSRYDDMKHLHVTDKNVWAMMGGKLHQIDAQTGSSKKEIPVAGRVTEFSPTENNLLIISEKQRREFDITLVNLASGEAKTESFTIGPKKEVVAEVKGKITKPATSGNLLKQELEGDDEARLAEKNTLLTSAGDHAVRVNIRVTKTNLVQVKVMRDAPKQSKLNSKTSVVSDPTAIAGEIFNDIKRSDGGQFRNVDESTYEVTLTRLMKANEAAWTGEVTGEPSFYAGRKVDLITGNKEVLLFSKENKLLGQAQLQYPIGAMGGFAFRRHENFPFLETEDTLYFWDKGTLTAFDITNGAKRWDYQLVGITSVVADGKGGLYVCGTTANVDAIKYSEEIQLENRPRALFVKLDAKSGKLDWTGQEGSKDVYLSGKFLYTTRPAGSTFGLMGGDSSAGRTYIHRVNPSSGKTEWELEHKGDIGEFEANRNRFVIISSDSIKVMKFLSL